MWKKCITSALFDIKNKSVKLNNRSFRVFTAFKKMLFNEDQLKGCIELIEY
jgi:hypothetical protein